MKKLAFALLLSSSSILSLAAMPALAEDAAKDAGKEAAPAAAPAEKTDKAAPAAKPKAADYTILRFGNQEIKSSEVRDIWSGLFPGSSAPDFDTFDESIRQNVLRGIVSERLIYDQAVKDGFDKNPDVVKRLAALQKQVVMQTYVENKSKTLITDQQLKAAYAEKAAAMKDQEEIRARHILVASEDEAKEVVKQLKKGGDFEKIAKDKSTDKGSGAQGGDLGYFTKERMIPEFATAAFKMKVGEISEPIKTSFGWHVIKVEDRRKMQAPTFDEMKDALKTEVTNKNLQDYIEGLLKATDIKYLDADGKEKEFSKSLKKADVAPKADAAPKTEAAAAPADKKPAEEKPAEEKKQ